MYGHITIHRRVEELERELALRGDEGVDARRELQREVNRMIEYYHVRKVTVLYIAHLWTPVGNCRAIARWDIFQRHRYRHCILYIAIVH